MQPGVADGGHLDVGLVLPMNGVHPEEREEEVDVDPLGAGAVGHDQAGIDLLQRPLGNDDGNLLDGRCKGLGRGHLAAPFLVTG